MPRYLNSDLFLTTHGYSRLLIHLILHFFHTVCLFQSSFLFLVPKTYSFWIICSNRHFYSSLPFYPGLKSVCFHNVFKKTVRIDNSTHFICLTQYYIQRSQLLEFDVHHNKIYSWRHCNKILHFLKPAFFSFSDRT